MTAEEAINELQNQCCVPNSVFKTPPYRARALGIEALKREVENRKHQPFLVFGLLPGETED